MTTAEGNLVYFDALETTNVQLSDIFKHIFNMRRYLGAIDVTLAEHLYLCGKLVDALKVLPDIFTTQNNFVNNLVVQRGYAVAHDLHEYLVVDIPSGLKPYLPDYIKIEHKAEIHVHKSIGLPLDYRNDQLIKYIDQLALVIEMAYHHHPAAARVNKKVKSNWLELKDLNTKLIRAGKNILDTYYSGSGHLPKTKLQHKTYVTNYLSSSIAKAKLELSSQLETV
jgi:hypothetical protein